MEESLFCSYNSSATTPIGTAVLTPATRSVCDSDGESPLLDRHLSCTLEANESALHDTIHIKDGNTGEELVVSFYRTLRLGGGNDTGTPMSPCWGTFPLFSLAQLRKRAALDLPGEGILADHVFKSSGVILPMRGERWDNRVRIPKNLTQISF